MLHIKCTLPARPLGNLKIPYIKGTVRSRIKFSVRCYNLSCWSAFRHPPPSCELPYDLLHSSRRGLFRSKTNNRNGVTAATISQGKPALAVQNRNLARKPKACYPFELVVVAMVMNGRNSDIASIVFRRVDGAAKVVKRQHDRLVQINRSGSSRCYKTH